MLSKKAVARHYFMLTFPQLQVADKKTAPDSLSETSSASVRAVGNAVYLPR